MANSSMCTGDYTFEPFISPACPGSPDFSIPFEQAIFSLLPSSIALVSGLVRFRALGLRKSTKLSGHGWFVCKLGCISVLAVVDLVLLIVSSISHTQDHGLAASASSLQLVCALGAMVVSYFEHRRSLRPSVVLQTYFLATLIFNSIQLRTSVLALLGDRLTALSSADVALRFAILVLESCPKRPWVPTNGEQRSPEDFVGFFGLRFFWWLNDLFVQGFRTAIRPSSLFQLGSDVAPRALSQVTSDSLLASVRQKMGSSLSRHSQSKTRSHYALFYSILRLHHAMAMAPMLPKLLYLGCQYSQPFLIQKFLAFVSSDPNDSTQFDIGPGLVALFGASYLGAAVFNSYYWQSVNKFNTAVQGSLLLAIYSKLLVTKENYHHRHSPLTLITVDMQVVAYGLRVLHEFWSALLAIGLGLWLLYNHVGIAFLAPLVVVFLILISSSYLGSRVRSGRLKFLHATQRRVKHTRELIKGLTIVKLLGLSSLLEADTKRLRTEEVKAQRSYRRILVGTLSMAQSVFALSSLATFGSFVLLAAFRDHLAFDTQSVFTSLAILKLFTSPLLETVQYIATFISALSSLERIQDYMQEDEGQFVPGIDGTRATRSDRDIGDAQNFELHKFQSPTVFETIQNLIIPGFDTSNETKGVQIPVETGSLTVVTGRIGSGKSTFLKALLSSFTATSSEPVSSSSCGYCPQEPWICNSSVRDNIIGPSLWIPDWYEIVMNACDLRDDVNSFPNGDGSLLGSGGTSLSGGQRKRIGLARAIYAKPTILVLDDPFAGLDQRTEYNVFDRLFGDCGLLRTMGTPVFLSTHRGIWLAKAHRMIKIDEQHRIHQNLQKPAAAGATTSLTPTQASKQVAQSVASETQTSQVVMAAEVPSEPDHIDEAEDPVKTKASVRRFYLQSIGMRSLILFASTCAIWVASTVVQAIVLQRWAQLQTPIQVSLKTYLPIFAAVSVSTIALVALFLWFTYENVCPRASINIHNYQLRALMGVSISFLSTIDHGTIINRFSQDLSLIDGQLSSSFVSMVMLTMTILAQTGILIATAPFIAAFFPVVMVVFWAIQRVYLRTARQLRVLDIEAKAPLASHVTESIAGLTTIAALAWSGSFRDKFTSLTNDALKPFYLLESIQNWLNCVLDLTVAGIATLLAGLVVALRHRVNPGLLGLALTGLMDFGFYFREIVIEWTQVEASLGAVQRVRKFERSATKDMIQRNFEDPPLSWPSQGGVELLDVSASYTSSGPNVLRNISLSVPAGTKLAICGRTGSGKSSLVSLLFGLISPSTGSVKIDNQDIATIDPQKIASRLSVLPQHQFMLAGSFRRNLCPFDGQDISDSRCAQVLREIHLWIRLCEISSISEDSSPSHLLDCDAELLSNLSEGELQLLCLARTILKQSNILVIDEATSNVDHATETTIMAAIGKEFKTATIIAVAHRLDTVVDFDQVVVMEGGRILEQGRPRDLLEDATSAFSQLCYMSK